MQFEHSFPSCEVGTAPEFGTGNWSLRSVYMNLKNEEDRTYNYFAGQAGYRLETALGEGNYQAIFSGETRPSTAGLAVGLR